MDDEIQRRFTAIDDFALSKGVAKLLFDLCGKVRKRNFEIWFDSKLFRKGRGGIARHKGYFAGA
jgi:hypothetical protein